MGARSPGRRAGVGEEALCRLQDVGAVRRGAVRDGGGAGDRGHRRRGRASGRGALQCGGLRAPRGEARQGRGRRAGAAPRRGRQARGPAAEAPEGGRRRAGRRVDRDGRAHRARGVDRAHGRGCLVGGTRGRGAGAGAHRQGPDAPDRCAAQGARGARPACRCGVERGRRGGVGRGGAGERQGLGDTGGARYAVRGQARGPAGGGVRGCAGRVR